MAEPADAKPDTTVQQGAAAHVAAGSNLSEDEAGRQSYRREGDGADPGERKLGREDPTTDGETARDKDNVQIR